MNRLSTAKRATVVAALVEGNSVRATARMTDVSKPTILKLLAELGPACAAYQDRVLRNLKCRRVQCDEIWQFCYAKERNVPQDKRGVFGYGDVWTWVAIDADTKLVPSWRVGSRDLATAYDFMHDLAGSPRAFNSRRTVSRCTSKPSRAPSSLAWTTRCCQGVWR
jgi:hypothetical protein